MFSLKERDLFQNLLVTRVSDKYCFFGKKRLSWSTIDKLIQSGEKIMHENSPDSVVNWNEKESVVEYHNSFRHWNTYLSGNSNRFKFYSGVLDVVNGLVLYENEYYLPCPIISWEGNDSRWNTKQNDIQDGRYNVTLYKQENTWYPREDVNLRTSITLNLFQLGSKVVKSVSELKPNTEELWASQYGDAINFRYTMSTWDGLCFEVGTIDVKKLFHNYFVKQRWGDNLNIELTDSQIYDIMYPIEGKLRTIISNALYYREFNIDISESYGEVSISNSLQFDKDVAIKLFSLIQEQINKH